jgi:hypothetical protein
MKERELIGKAKAKDCLAWKRKELFIEHFQRMLCLLFASLTKYWHNALAPPLSTRLSLHHSLRQGLLPRSLTLGLPCIAFQWYQLLPQQKDNIIRANEFPLAFLSQPRKTANYTSSKGRRGKWTSGKLNIFIVRLNSLSLIVMFEAYNIPWIDVDVCLKYC